MKDLDRIVLVGNPNVGKSLIFNYLTGIYAVVSNYPGTTVEVTKGNLKWHKNIEVIDTPGVNSLIPQSDDERVTLDILLQKKCTVILVADAKNVERSLVIAIQLAHLKIPFVFTLNMSDEANARGITINEDELSNILNVPVVTTVAINRKGLSELYNKLTSAFVPIIDIRFNANLEKLISISSKLVENSLLSSFKSLLIISGEKKWIDNYNEKNISAYDEALRVFTAGIKIPVSAVIAYQYSRIAKNISKQVINRPKQSKHVLFEKIFASRFLSAMLLLFILFVFYLIVGKLSAGFIVDFLETGYEQFVTVPLASFFSNISSNSVFVWFYELMLGKYGLISMGMSYALAVVLPIVVSFFVCFGFLEDSGILPRISVMMNRGFKLVGLSGKAVIPIILGFGCGTMAILATRILENKRQRILATFIIALGIPCSAQLGVVLGIASNLPIFAVIVWLSTVVLFTFTSAFFANKILKGVRIPFMTELPPIRFPAFKNIIQKTWNRTLWYLKEAVPLFLLGTFILFIMDKYNVLGFFENILKPVVVNILGLPIETSVAFLIGFLRRDYGAAFLYDLFRAGSIGVNQSIIALVVITLFVPCIATFMVMIKEHGLKIAFVLLFIAIGIAVFAGGMLNQILLFI